MIMPHKYKTIFSPAGGWREKTYYVVKVSFSAQNPIHEAIFFTGFLRHGRPSEYNKIFCSNYEIDYDYNCAHFIRPVKEIYTEGDADKGLIDVLLVELKNQ